MRLRDKQLAGDKIHHSARALYPLEVAEYERLLKEDKEVLDGKLIYHSIEKDNNGP